MIKFISHETYPDDPYIKESCTLCIDEKQRFTYVRKTRKDGAFYWSPISTAVVKDGAKKFVQSFEWDSNFLQKDILEFLNARTWERQAPKMAMQATPFNDSYKPAAPTTYQPAQAPIPQQYEQQSFIDECPF